MRYVSLKMRTKMRTKPMKQQDFKELWRNYFAVGETICVMEKLYAELYAELDDYPCGEPPTAGSTPPGSR